MRKILTGFIIIIEMISVVALCACGSSSGALRLDAYSWTLESVQNTEDGSIITSVTPSDVACEASGRKITITDSSTDKAYSGTYSIESESPSSY